ncbi:hypothetical protein Tco_0733423 [Tanacetum coccineum]
MMEIMEQYMSKNRGNYGLGVARPKINDKTHFELKGQFLKELRENTFSGSKHEVANEQFEKVLEIVDLFHIPEVSQDQIMLRAFPMSLTGAEVILFYNGLDVPTRQILDSIGVIPTKTAADAKAKEGMNLDSKSELIGEAINESFDPNYGNYIKLNDLDVPLEPRMDQDNNFEPTLDESIIVNEPTFKSYYKMKFSCMIGYKHVNADLLLKLSINMMTKRFYNSIIKDKGDREGKKLVGTLIDMLIFVGNFSIILGFSIIDDMDIIFSARNPRSWLCQHSPSSAPPFMFFRSPSGSWAPKTPYGVFLELPKLGTVTPEKIKQETPKSTITEAVRHGQSGVVLGMPFCKKFVSCQKIMEKFAHRDECERIDQA